MNDWVEWVTESTLCEQVNIQQTWDVGSMLLLLGQRRSKPTLGQRLMFAGKGPIF